MSGCVFLFERGHCFMLVLRQQMVCVRVCAPSGSHRRHCMVKIAFIVHLCTEKSKICCELYVKVVKTCPYPSIHPSIRPSIHPPSSFPPSYFLNNSSVTSGAQRPQGNTLCVCSCLCWYICVIQTPLTSTSQKTCGSWGEECVLKERKGTKKKTAEEEFPS